MVIDERDEFLRENRNPNSTAAPIVWPDGRMQWKLDPKVAGLVWQHAHRGHELFHSECYACVCEDAY